MNESVALITGASRGIGRAVAVAFSHAGYKVAICARTRKGLEETAEACENPDDVLILEYDLAEPKSRGEVVESVIGRWKRLDVLINNAGVHEGKSLASWHQTMQVNLSAVMDVTYFAIPHLEKSEDAAIINVASIAGIMATGNAMAYSASKHGVVGFSRALFEEVRDKGIKVSAICPGYVATDMVSTLKLNPDLMIQPEDIASTALFVASFPSTACPTEIVVRPQKSPRRKAE